MSRSSTNAACCRQLPEAPAEGLPKLVLVGCPNVGKSALFNRLTGAYVAVSNYPGTTVEVSRGKARWGEREFEVIDTPGMYSLRSLTDEERVARSILLRETADTVLHVIDAKNLPRMLPMTLQLIEAALPLVLVLNMADEMSRTGVSIDVPALSESLGVPVVVTSTVTGEGLDALRETILLNRQGEGAATIAYPSDIERAAAAIGLMVGDSLAMGRRAAALLLLQGDLELNGMLADDPDTDGEAIERIARPVREKAQLGLDYVLAVARQEKTDQLCGRVYRSKKENGLRFGERLSHWMMHPLYGIPILLASLYALYEFVGVFGAQTSVDFLEHTIFEQRINPYVIKAAAAIIPWAVLRDLFVGEYGVVTLGVRYAVALILPIVATFFIAFSVIEDTGYLPRLAMLIDRLFKTIGLSGRAVIPMVLGFGCDTMATMVTRTLETKRERLLATLLLSLAIPCSAQLGVIFALLAGSPKSLLVWGVVMALNFLLVGYLAAKVLPGAAPLFYMEVPPLRLPRWRNVLTKTYTRVEWYFREILPMFLWASVVIWLGRLTGLFDRAVAALKPAVSFVGLPVETAVSFLFGFFRRDYGAAGLYDLKQSGVLHGIPLVVAVVAMTLFLPCIAQFTITVKERGWKTAVGMAAFIFPYAFLVSFLVGKALPALGVTL
ncbi:MAG TPA: ferrous iron transport protein B [Candidatus Deferrimicrobiaceae bacterium]|jgi:ferrous iron transport protein B